jgi:two-component system response regulator DevR
VLLDLKLSAGADTEGLDLCARLHQRHPDVGVLVLTSFLDERLVVQAIQNGASGYVIKDVDTSELVRAIRAVRRGESAFDSRSAAAMVRSLNARSVLDTKALTERELEVLQHLARGRSNREIGRRLFISETTVKFHVGNLMRKMEVSRRAEAVYAARRGRSSPTCGCSRAASAPVTWSASALLPPRRSHAARPDPRASRALARRGVLESSFDRYAPVRDAPRAARERTTTRSTGVTYLRGVQRRTVEAVTGR